jgi:hypothetical protein
MLFTDDVQPYSDKPSPSPFPLSFLLTMFAPLTFNSVTLLRLHFLQLTTRLLSPTSFHLQQHHLVQLHFLQLATRRYSSLFHSSLISVAPGSTKWQNLSHFA